jgi:preprotein translocase subunit SecE
MEKDDGFWLAVAYVAFGAVAIFFWWNLVQTVGIQTGWFERYQWFQTANHASSLVLGGLSLWLLRRNKERNEYFLDAIGELRKVAWPSSADTKRLTMVVCVVVGIFSCILMVFDIVWAAMLKYLLA